MILLCQRYLLTNSVCIAAAPAESATAATGATSETTTAAAAPATADPASRPAPLASQLEDKEREEAHWQSVSAAAYPPAAATLLEHTASLADLADESGDEAAPKRYTTPDASGAAERRAWCDLEEASFATNTLTPLAPQDRLVPAALEAPLPVAPLLTPSLRATLVDLLELHDFGEPVAWPAGFDARIARQRLAPGG